MTILQLCRRPPPDDAVQPPRRQPPSTAWFNARAPMPDAPCGARTSAFEARGAWRHDRIPPLPRRSPGIAAAARPARAARRSVADED